jgi:hypothetical protein
MNFSHDTITIRLKAGVPTYRRKAVELPEGQFAVLRGKGENGKIDIYKHTLKYKT